MGKGRGGTKVGRGKVRRRNAKLPPYLSKKNTFSSAGKANSQYVSNRKKRRRLNRVKKGNCVERLSSLERGSMMLVRKENSRNDPMSLKKTERD